MASITVVRSVALDVELAQRITERARREGVSVSKLARDAFSRYLDNPLDA